MIPKEVEVQILRLFHTEKWPIGTIAAQLSLHHETVERVLLQNGMRAEPCIKARLVDPYLDFVKETWRRYPKLPASRLWRMCRERGYPGAPDHFRAAVRMFRPVPHAEAFLRLSVLQGDQAQVDWAHFGKLSIDGGERPLVAFVAVLSWSRAIFMRYFLGQHVENLLRGIEAAFQTWGGYPRVLLFDNPKTVVLERVGDAIRFHPSLLAFTSHYRFEARPVAPGRGNEKPRVERAIRYARHAFFLARRFRGIEDLNAQARAWCMGEAMERPWPDDPRRKVRDVYEEECPKLLALPENTYPLDERREVSCGKTPYVRFDGNDYSVPHTLVRKTLVVAASVDTVRIFHGTTEAARHARSYGRRRIVEDPVHIKSLVQEKRKAREHRGQNRLTHAVPRTRDLLDRLAERGQNLGGSTTRLLELLDTYGAERLDKAVGEVLAREVPHVHAVRQVLDRDRAERNLPPLLPIPLTESSKARDVKVRPHSLDGYDALLTPKNKKEDPS